MSNSQLLTDEILAIIDQIYAAALDPEAWDGVVESMNRLMPMAGIGLSGMHGGDNPSYFFIQQGYDPDAVQEFLANHTEENPWRDILPTIPTGTIFNPYASSYSEKFLKTGLAAFMQRRDMNAGIAAVVSNEPGQTFHLSIDHSPNVSETARSDVVALTSVLTPHLARSFNILHRTAIGRSGAELMSELVDRLITPTIVVNSELKVRYANVSGMRLFEETTNGIRRDFADTLSLKDEDALDALKRAVHAAINSNLEDGMMPYVPFRIPGGNDKGRISIVPIVADSSLSQSGLTQFLFVPERLALLFFSTATVRDEVRIEQLRRKYALTPAQGRLACALCNGLSLEDYAEMQGIKIVTVRNHLQAIFEKTGVNRQNQLVATLLETTASW